MNLGVYGTDNELPLYSSGGAALISTAVDEKKAVLAQYCDLGVLCSNEYLGINVFLGVGNLEVDKFKDAALFAEITSRTGMSIYYHYT